jgi:hypothetical protein
MAKNKKKHDVRQIIIKVLALIMAVLMVIAMAATVIYYLMH